MARIVGLATHLEQKRLADIAREINRFVRIGETDEVINQRIADNSKPLINIYHYHNNHLGTPQELTNEQGDVIWLSYDYAWGGQYDTFYKTQAIGNHKIAEHELQPIRFQGQFFDTETSLHYNRFRYYDSDVGMFIGRDPIGLLGGNNVFQYAPNPTGWVDPWGLSKFANPHVIKINGRKPINYSYAGKTFYLQGKLATKYPHGVPFNMFGLPDFTRYTVKNVHIGVPINDYQDFKKANILAFGENNTFGADAPTGFVWHHDGDKLRLLPKDIHDAVKHTGSAAQNQTRKRKQKAKKCTI